MAPQRSGSCTFLLTAVCTQSCMQASGRECCFPDGSLQKQEYSWKNSVNHESLQSLIAKLRTVKHSWKRGYILERIINCASTSGLSV